MGNEASSGKAFGLPWSSVEYYLRRGLDTTFRMNGTKQPRVDYVVLNRDIELQVDLTGHQRLPISKLPMIRIDEVAVRGSRVARVRTADPALQRDFHDLICAVAERMILRQQRFDQALAETLRAWTALLRGPRALLQQQQIGLLGELAVLRTLAGDDKIGWAAAAEAWVGVDAEEHDFALVDFDVEVKTTSVVKPLHTIHGIGQLTPKYDRPLWLVSLRVTRGGNAGVALSDVARIVRVNLAAYAPGHVELLDEALAAVGWEDGSPNEQRWVLESAPQVFAVRGTFPRIDESFLGELSAENRARIDQISYRIDLTGITAAEDGPAVLSMINFPDITRAVEP